MDDSNCSAVEQPLTELEADSVEGTHLSRDFAGASRRFVASLFAAFLVILCGVLGGTFLDQAGSPQIGWRIAPRLFLIDLR